MFKYPFYVSDHAIQRFRERVANLPARTIRTIIQAALQDNQQSVGVQYCNHVPCPVFRARYRDKEYWIVVRPETRKTGKVWPVVPTILEAGMERVIKYERRGWDWSHPRSLYAQQRSDQA